MLNYGIKINSIPFYLMMSNKYSNSIIESIIFDIENLKIDFFQDSKFLTEIIQTKDIIMIKGIKEIKNPIFNKKILDLGKDLDLNKLDGKLLKYLRYLLKVSPQIVLINLSNNYINGDNLKHLIYCIANISFLEIFYVNINLLEKIMEKV